MKDSTTMNRKNLLVLVMALLLAGCLGTPSRPSTFYVLSADPGTPVSGRASSDRPLYLGLGPVSLPDLFDRPQIVTRHDKNLVNLAEYDRWAGDLKQNLKQVLVQNLMGRLDTDDVILYPWPSDSQLDYAVTIQFFRFDGQLDKAVLLEGVWNLFDGRERCQLASHRFRIEESPIAPGYPALVSAISSGVARLSDNIAATIVKTTPGC